MERRACGCGTSSAPRYLAVHSAPRTWRDALIGSPHPRSTTRCKILQDAAGWRAGLRRRSSANARQRAPGARPRRSSGASDPCSRGLCGRAAAAALELRGSDARARLWSAPRPVCELDAAACRLRCFCVSSHSKGVILHYADGPRGSAGRARIGIPATERVDVAVWRECVNLGKTSRCRDP